MWKQLKRQIWQYRGVLITAPGITAIVVALRFTGLLQLLELATLDQFFQLRPVEPIDARIVIIEIDESDVRQQAQWPMSDAVLARLLDNIRRQQPRAIGLDLYRDLPVYPGHSTLTQIFKTTPNLIGVQKVSNSSDSSSVNPPPVLKQKDQVGSNDFPLDSDGKVRRVLLYQTSSDGETILSFGFRLAMLYLEPEGIQPELTSNNLVKLGSTVFQPFESNDGGYVGAEAGGYQAILNYRGTIKQFPVLSMTDVLNNKIPAGFLRDRIVLIGPTAASLNDLFYTPYTSRLFALPKRTPGVVIHANLISQLLSSALEGRPVIRTWSEPLEVTWIFAWAVIGSVLSWGQRNSTRVAKHTPWVASLIILAATSLLAGSCLAFTQGLWIPVIPPILALTGSAIAITAYIARTAGEIRRTFGRYVTNEVVATLLENPEGLKLGGERRKITILTSDIRGFTAISERLPAEEVIRVINLYLGYMADVITQYRGTIDEFMGDGILVLFGAPAAKPDDAERAIACAVAMQLAMVSVNEKMAQLGLPAIEMGIGINTGEVVVGNIGSEKRTKYGVVGNQVNLTYRIESYTVGGQIFVSESTIREVGPIVQIDGQRKVQPKGVQEPVTIYEVSGLTGNHNLFLFKEEEQFFDLLEFLPLQYAILDGKHIDHQLAHGWLVKLSAKGGEIKLDPSDDPEKPVPLTNLKLNLLCFKSQTEAVSEDIYAKVIEKPAGDYSFYIRFTEEPPDVKACFSEILKKVGTID